MQARSIMSRVNVVLIETCPIVWLNQMTNPAATTVVKTDRIR
jgi:hypothetical protein